jgi:hypothetical protein
MSREIDERVHREVMGIQWDAKRCRVCGWPLSFDRGTGCVVGDCSYRGEFHGRADEAPSYSENLLLAWRVVEKLKADGIYLGIDNFGYDGEEWRVCVSLPDPEGYEAVEAETAPLAICLAALKAIESRVSGPDQREKK